MTIRIMDQKMRNVYGINSSESTAQAAQTLITEIQGALFNLKFLLSSDAITGTYDLETVNAVKVYVNTI